MIKETQHYEAENGVVRKYSNGKDKSFYTVEKGNGDYLDFYMDESSALYALCDPSNTEGRVESIQNPWKTDQTESLFYLICMVYESTGHIKSAVKTVSEYFDLETGCLHLELLVG